MATAAAVKKADILPDLKTQRAMLEQQETQAKQQAFQMFIATEYARAQGIDADGKKKAKTAAADTDDQRKNVLKGLARIQELLKELPELELEVEGAD